MSIAWVNIALPVRSAVLKQDTGGLVFRRVTTSKSPLLYVFAVLFASVIDSKLPEIAKLYITVLITGCSGGEGIETLV
jgi:hypothetical protein